MVSRNNLLPGTVISSSRIFRAVSLGTCFRITSRTRSTVLLLAATRYLLQHPHQGHRPFTPRGDRSGIARTPRLLYGRPYSILADAQRTGNFASLCALADGHRRPAAD